MFSARCDDSLRAFVGMKALLFRTRARMKRPKKRPKLLQNFVDVSAVAMHDWELHAFKSLVPTENIHEKISRRALP